MKDIKIEPFPDDIDRESFGHWLSGFADGEATFQLRMVPQKNRPFPNYQSFIRITLRDDDIEALRLIQSFWNCGRIYYSDNSRSKIPNANPVAVYSVSCVSDLSGVVIPHFERYPLRAKKRTDFLVWKRGVALMAAVQKRPKRYREGHAPNRHGGTYPKWTLTENDQFAALIDELRGQQRYGSVTPPTQPNGKRPRGEQAMLFGDD